MPNIDGPWPHQEIAYFRARARRVLPDHPSPRNLTARFLKHLAERGEPDTGGPVYDLRDWARRESNGRLRDRLLAFEVEQRDLSRLAQAEAGMPNRRGDVIHVRSKAFWWEMRTK